MARQQLLFLLEDDEDKLNPTILSRRSLSSQQYNSSIDARDAETEVQQSPQNQNDTIDDDQPTPLKNEYNVSNDETGLLLSGFGLSPDESEVELGQSNFGKAPVEITTTTSTPTPTSTPTGTTTNTNTSPSPYFYSCADNSNDDRVSNKVTEASTSASSATEGSTSEGSFSDAKQVVRFDYDLLIASSAETVSTLAQQQQSIESVYTMVRQFEARLLENVGSELSKHNGGTSLVCGEDGGDVVQLASGRERKGGADGMRLRGGEQRKLQSSLSGPWVKLSRLSSLPSDEVLNGEYEWNTLKML